jgi:DNA-binding transcriptional LysR family regulator
MLDLNDVALFVQVVRYGSFAEAARRLGMPPNTLSRRVQQLEDQLGMRLLQRSTRKLTLTNTGEVFHERCAGAVDGLNEAAQDLLIGTETPSGRVRVAAPADFFDFFQMEWVAEFLATYPQVRLDFVLSDESTDLIADQIDLALRGGAMQDSSYIGRQVMVCETSDVLVASPAYLAAHGQPGNLQDLARHACITHAQPGKPATWRLIGPTGATEEVQITPRFSGNTAQALRKAAVAGVGITLLTYPITRRDLEAGLLVPVLPQYKRPGRGLHALYPSRRHLPPAVSAFMALVTEKLKMLQD